MSKADESRCGRISNPTRWWIAYALHSSDDGRARRHDSRIVERAVEVPAEKRRRRVVAARP